MTTAGHVLTHVVGGGLFKRCARLLGRDDWIDDPDLVTDQQRGDARDRLCEAMRSWCETRTTEEALAELRTENAGRVALPASSSLLRDPPRGRVKQAFFGSRGLI